MLTDFSSLSATAARGFLQTLTHTERHMLWTLLINTGSSLSVDQPLYSFLTASSPELVLSRLRTRDSRIEWFLRAILDNKDRRTTDLLMLSGIAKDADFRTKAQALLLFTDRSSRIARPEPHLKPLLSALFSPATFLLKPCEEDFVPTFSVWEDAEDLIWSIRMDRQDPFTETPLAAARNAECERCFRDAAMSGYSGEIDKTLYYWRNSRLSTDSSALTIAENITIKDGITIDTRAKELVYTLLENLEDGKWYMTEPILNHLLLSYNMTSNNQSLANRYIKAAPDLKEKIYRDINRTMLLSTLYTLSYFGVLDLYEEDKDTQNGYELLSAVRLTPLGSYIVGHTRKKPERKPDTQPVIADDKMLMLTYDGSRWETRRFLSSIGTPFGKSRYIVTKDSFNGYGGYKTKESLDTLLSLLQPPVPQNWQDFISEIKNGKVSSIKVLDKGKVLSIENGKDAAKIMSDQKIQELVKPLGKGLLFLPDRNERSFIARIEKLGFKLDRFLFY